MPLLARMLASPLSIDVRRGAIADLGLLLADRRIAHEGRIAVAVVPCRRRAPARRAAPAKACAVW